MKRTVDVVHLVWRVDGGLGCLRRGLTAALVAATMNLSDFLCARGHEMMSKGKYYDRSHEHNQETEGAEAFSG